MHANRKSTVPFVTVPIESAGVPIYRQIYENLRRQILSGALKTGSQMPSTRLLANQLSVSRMTVVNAYEQLFAEGYVAGKSGSGTYVAAVLPEELLETKNKGQRRGCDQRAAKVGGKLILSKRGERLTKVDYLNLRASRTNGELKTFHYGLPAMDAFPFDVWSRLAARRLQKISMPLFGSGDPAGYEPLRRSVAAYLQTARAVRCSPEQVFIVGGAQQALALIAQVLLDERDTVWMENPCYPGARDLFQTAGARIESVPVDAEGFDLNFAARRKSSARLAVVTPSHQFPLGVVMSLARRLQLLEWARKNDAFVVEDDYDSEFRYAGRPLASLQGLDGSGERVIYVGTFSKTIFPAQRLGFMVVPDALVDVFAAARALSDNHSPTIEQAILTDFIEEGHFARHIRRMRALYAERQNALVEAARISLAGLLEVSKDDAGMHLVGWLPDDADDVIAAEKARRQSVETKPLSAYCLKPLSPKRGGLILGYTAFTNGQIRNGIERLAKALA